MSDVTFLTLNMATELAQHLDETEGSYCRYFDLRTQGHLSHDDALSVYSYAIEAVDCNRLMASGGSLKELDVWSDLEPTRLEIHENIMAEYVNLRCMQSLCPAEALQILRNNYGISEAALELAISSNSL